MKFNDKLIELRNREHLSQEEFGEKLKVSVQDVIDWEQGKTIPDSNKLVEISKLFNIPVDDLTNEEIKLLNELKNDNKGQKRKDKSKKKKERDRESTIKVLLVSTLAILLIAILGLGIYQHDLNSKKEKDDKKDKFPSFSDILEMNSNEEKEFEKKFEITKFNGNFESYLGTNPGSSIKSMLSKVISNNEKSNRKVSIIYNEIESLDVSEIDNIRSSIKESQYYNVNFKYDSEGYINKIIFKREITEHEVKSFNNTFEHLYSGSLDGFFIKAAIDEVIKLYNKGEKTIVVNCYGRDYYDVTSIKNIKNNFSDFNKYDVSYAYDENGFINKMIIK